MTWWEFTVQQISVWDERGGGGVGEGGIYLQVGSNSVILEKKHIFNGLKLISEEEEWLVQMNIIWKNSV